MDREAGRVGRSSLKVETPPTLLRSAPSPDGEGVARSLLPLLILAHAILWIALPLALEGSIRLDVSEGAIGGREWQLAYLRHPPFTTWAVEVARWAGPLRYIAVYALGQALALSGILLLALAAAGMESEPMRGRQVAGLTILMGLASPVATYIPIQLSHNIGMMLATGLVVLTAWEAFERGTLWRWLAFGVAVGLSLWVKYAIGLVVLPLMLAFLVVPQWRRQLLTPGPWLAVLAALVVIAPHAIFVFKAGATTLSFAARTVSSGFATNLRYAVEFMANAALFMLPMAVIAGLCSGFRSIGVRIAGSLRPATATRQDIFRHAVAFGPVLLTAGAALLAGVKPRLLWLTPMVPVFALWFAHFALPLRDEIGKRRALRLVAGMAALLVVSYVLVRLVSPYANGRPLYPDFDGPALARLAEIHWRSNEALPLRYIVSFGQQKGRQAAGSIAFDLPSPKDAPIHVMEDGSRVASPWIDVDDLKRRGALVVSPVPLAADQWALPITHIIELPRPMVRGASQPESRIWLGIVEPGG